MTPSINVLHEESGPLTRWTTVNMAEVLPGVLTPLGWTFWRDPAEAGMRRAFYDAGALTRSQLAAPNSVDDRLTGLFHGRYAANLSLIASLCDLIPGSSGKSFETQIFGAADPDVVRGKSIRRYPVVAVRMPLAVALLRRRLAARRAAVDAWWRRSVGAGAAPPAVRLHQARSQLQKSLHIHLFCSLVAQACYEQLARLAEDAGSPGLELELMTGYGDMEETRLAEDLWRVSRGAAAMVDFLDRHGYHGPREGDLSSLSWRENPTPVEQLVDKYAAMSDAATPSRGDSDRRAVRIAAEERLLAASTRRRRAIAGPVLRAAATFVPLREVGKVAFLQAIDVGRSAARELGAALTKDGRIADPEDVFFLTLDELYVCRTFTDPKELVAQRRATYLDYHTTALPERWTGRPERTTTTAGDGGELYGVPVYPGVVEGRARVILDPSQADRLEAGDILVCETTDPSWVVLFQLASAVVIDVGGPLSHGAIVARELGIPAVINTRRATRVIRDGDRVRVDGATGAVVRRDRAAVS